MANISKMDEKNTSKLKDIKENIQRSYLYFKPSYDRFHQFRRFVFKTTMDAEDISVLKELQKPQIEFNILEAYISRQRAEFSKHEPSIEASAKPGKIVDPKLIRFYEDHLRYALDDSNNKYGTEYAIFTDTMSGGFSVMKVTTDYANSMAFDQEIMIKRAFDPTLCGFDPLAQQSHKGDGRYCFELYPKTEKEAKQMGVNVSQCKFIKDMGGFSWSYQTNTEKIVMFAEYYEKRISRKRIVQIAPIESLKIPSQVMLADQYKSLVERWDAEGILAPAPAIINERMTELETIDQYILTENEIIEHKKTDWCLFPLVFVDGNSIMIKETTSSPSQQYTRPFVYNAMGVQKLKNFAGQCLANELENMVMHKFMVAKEAIPDQYADAWMNYQKPNVLIYNQFYEENVELRLDPPREIVRTPIPPEITNTFRLCDEMTQQILGNYDANIAKLPDTELSGIAVQESISLSNEATKPYIVGFMEGLTRVAQVFVDILPKYNPTPRTVPILDSEGKRAFVEINGEKGLQINECHNNVDIAVKAGANFALQKSKALTQMIALMNASPLFAQFVNTKGLPQLLDNIDIRGIDELKEGATQFMQELQQLQAQQQAQAQAQQQQGMQAQQNDPRVMIDMAKIQLQMKELEEKMKQFDVTTHLKVAEMENERETKKESLTNERIKLLSDIKLGDEASQVQMHKADTERYAKNVDLAIKHLDMKHRHEEGKRTKHGTQESKKETETR